MASRNRTGSEDLRIEVESVDALFASSSPFRGPRLHPEVAAELIKALEALPRLPVHPTLRIDAVKGGEADAGRVAALLRSHFEADAEDATTELGTLYRNAAQAGGLALLAVLGLIALSEALISLDGPAFLNNAGRALVVLAWVALWKPSEMFLYEHIPIRRRRRMDRALANARVVICPIQDP